MPKEGHADVQHCAIADMQPLEHLRLSAACVHVYTKDVGSVNQSAPVRTDDIRQSRCAAKRCQSLVHHHACTCCTLASRFTDVCHLGSYSQNSMEMSQCKIGPALRQSGRASLLIDHHGLMVGSELKPACKDLP